MKIDSLLSHVFGFYPHVEDTRETAKANHSPILVFRGIRYHRDQPAVDAGTSFGAQVARVFRGRPSSPASALSGLDVLQRQQAIRVFRGSVVQ